MEFNQDLLDNHLSHRIAQAPAAASEIEILEAALTRIRTVNPLPKEQKHFHAADPLALDVPGKEIEPEDVLGRRSRISGTGERFAAMTVPTPGVRVAPVFQELKDNTGKRLTLLDQHQVAELARARQEAEVAILSCKKHEARNCSCWSNYRALLHRHQDAGADSPMAIALGFYYDSLADLAANRPKKSEAEEILKRLEGRLEQISDAQPVI